jgi:hypothetical protein
VSRVSPRVLVTVRRDEDVEGRDLELPASLPASDLRRLIGHGLEWPASTADATVRVEPGGRVLGERESLAEAGVRDGAWLVFGAQPEPLLGAPVSPFRLGETAAARNGAPGSRIMRSRPGYIEPNRLVVLGVCGAVIIGALAGLVLLTRSTPDSAPVPPAVVATSAPVVSTQVVAAPRVEPTALPTAPPTPLPVVQDRPTLAPTARPTLAPTRAPTAPPTLAPTVVPTVAPTPVPSAATVWPATVAQLDPLWGRDWPGAIGVLQGFLDQFPGDPTATDKLYAALVEYGRDRASDGQPDQARAALQGAATLRPERPEALDELQALAPRPTPVVSPALPTAAPAPPAVRVAPPPIQQQPPPAEEPPAPPLKQPVTREGFDSPGP